MGMEFRILGPLEVFSDGQALDLGGAKQRALLAVLLLDANNVVSTDRLIDALWEDDPPESAQKALQVYVSRLRKLLGKERLQTKAPGYLLQLEDGELDLDRFRELQERGRPAEALSIWRGPPLSDFAHQRFAQPEIARLEDLRLACLEERIEQDLQARRHTELTGELEALVAEHPLRERLRGQLMLALYRSGRQAEALDAYQAARRALVDELGIDPSRELRELHQRILNQDAGLDLGRPGDEAESEAGAGFVGRESELAELTAGLDDASGGRGRLFLLQGEPGIGKSRLADELLSRAKARGAHALVGRCWEAGGAPAYWPWTQSLRTYVRTAEPSALRRQLGTSMADVARIVPQLRELFPGLPEPEPSESEAARFRLFDSTATFLKDASVERPLVLAFDDLHAADEPSLLLLRYLATVLEDSRIVIVGTFRDLDPTVQDPLESTVAELGRASVTRRIRLFGLSRQEVARLAESTAGAAPSDRLVAELHEETGGNPLFVSEIVRLLAAEDRLGRDGPGRRIPIPETVREAIGRRLRHLSGECRRVLSLASVFGRELELVALEQVADYTGIDKLLRVLDEAITARVVEELPGTIGRLRFGHALTRDSLYEEIPATHRARLHRRVAEVLEALYVGNPEPHLAELAHHFSMAVPAAAPTRAVEYARRAGEHALGVLAYEEAARLFSLGIDALALEAAPDERTLCELLLSLGDADIRAGNNSAAKQAFVEAAGIARRLDLGRELARAAAGYGGRLVFARAGDDPRLVPLLEEGLAALGEEEVALRVRLLARLAGALRDEPSRERRDRLSGDAVELARRSGNAVALADALDGRAAAIVAPDTIAECLELADELYEVADRAGDRERLASAHFHRFLLLVQLGDLAGAEAEVAGHSAVAEELRQPAQLWQVRSTQALIALATGRLREAEELSSQAFAYGERAQPGFAIPAFRLHRYMLCDFHGCIEEVEESIRELVVEYPPRVAFRCVLARLEAQLGNTSQARRELEPLVKDGCARLPFDLEWLYGMSHLAETAAAVGDAESAAVLYRLLVPWKALNTADVPEGMRGSTSRYLGLLAVTMRRLDEAKQHFDDALAMNERMGARPWHAHTQADYARMLIARAARGDAERARALLDQAAATYRDVGMDAYAATASALAREAAVSTP
jgi:DNA-binding SARP family transcriptional activator/tetratricopeptide (TPR) repeat protein